MLECLSCWISPLFYTVYLILGFALHCITLNRCGPCRFIAPYFEELAEKNPDVEFVKVDVDDAEDVAGECGISAMPTFQFYKGGVKIDEMRGANKEGLATKVAKLKWKTEIWIFFQTRRQEVDKAQCHHKIDHISRETFINS